MKKIFLKIVILLTIMFFGTSIVEAASYTISVGSKNLSKGNTTKLTIKGSDVTGRFNIKSSNSSVISISEDRTWIENNSYTITLSALSVGTSTITVTPSNVSDGSGKPADLSSKTITITVSLPREKSTDNNLKDLSVEGFEITPQFDKDTLDYSVDVPEGTKTINVSATKNSKYASVSGTGEIEVTEGINNLSIVVKSESGKEKIYNLVVNVIDQNPIYVTVDNVKYTVIKLRENYTCLDSFEESEIVIDSFSVPACTNGKIDYTLVGLKKEDGTIENFVYKDGKYTKYQEIVGKSSKIIALDYDGKIEGLKEYKEKINDNEYQVFKFSESSKFYVIYGVNVETGEKDFYVYDAKTKTFSLYDTEYINYLKDQNKIYLYVIITFGVGLFLSLICIILQNNSKSKLKKKLLSKNDEKKENNKSNKEKTKKTDDKNSIEEVIEETSEDTEIYNLFDDKKKNKKKSKK